MQFLYIRIETGIVGETTSMSNEEKLNIQEKVQQHLDRKKQAKDNSNNKINMNGSNQHMKSQLTKKPSNARRKMGS